LSSILLNSCSEKITSSDPQEPKKHTAAGNYPDISTFVEILNNKGDMVLSKLRETPIKGRLRTVSKVENENLAKRYQPKWSKK
jgi:hypothetical protein